MFNRRHMRRRFDRAADQFDSVDFVHAETRRGLFERLEGLTTKANTLCCCQTGWRLLTAIMALSTRTLGYGMLQERQQMT